VSRVPAVSTGTSFWKGGLESLGDCEYDLLQALSETKRLESALLVIRVAGPRYQRCPSAPVRFLESLYRTRSPRIRCNRFRYVTRRRSCGI